MALGTQELGLNFAAVPGHQKRAGYDVAQPGQKPAPPLVCWDLIDRGLAC